jgi:hypothetical protein
MSSYDVLKATGAEYGWDVDCFESNMRLRRVIGDDIVTVRAYFDEADRIRAAFLQFGPGNPRTTTTVRINGGRPAVVRTLKEHGKAS